MEKISLMAFESSNPSTQYPTACLTPGLCPALCRKHLHDTCIPTMQCSTHMHVDKVVGGLHTPLTVVASHHHRGARPHPEAGHNRRAAVGPSMQSPSQHGRLAVQLLPHLT